MTEPVELMNLKIRSTLAMLKVILLVRYQIVRISKQFSATKLFLEINSGKILKIPLHELATWPGFAGPPARGVLVVLVQGLSKLVLVQDLSKVAFVIHCALK